MTNAIVAEGLTKRFGPVTAVDGIDLQSRRAPSSASSARTARARPPPSTSSPPWSPPTPATPPSPATTWPPRPHQVRQLIGLAGQYASVDEMLTGTENLVLLARLTGAVAHRRRSSAPRTCSSNSASRTPPPARSRPTPAACAAASTWPPAWSPAPACCSSTSPRPASTRAAATTCGTSSASLTNDGVTVLLTTQYLEEADQLAEQIAVIDHGRMIATGTPQELKASTGSDTLDDVFLALTGHDIEPTENDNDLEESLA